MTDFYDYLIIGGGIAGISAAEAIRGFDADGHICVVSAEPHMPYSRVFLPAYVKNKIARERLFLRKEDAFARLRIDLLRGRAVVSVDAAGRRAVLVDAEELAYGKLLITAGGRARSWPRAGTDEGVFRLQTLDDADRLAGALDSGAIRQPVVIGSSFIALELIEIFLQRGVVPRAFMRGAHFFDSALDLDGAAFLHENLAQQGVSLICGDEVMAVEREGAAIKIRTRQSGVLEADAVGVGIGIDRNTEFLARSGIICGRNGVSTNAFLETNIPGAFAAGDIAEYFDIIAGRHRLVGNWTHAILQGRHAGFNMTRGDAKTRVPFSSPPAYTITNLGMHLAMIGECDGALLAVSRSDRKRRQYERFFMRDGVLVGAFLINRAADKALLAELIGRRARAAPYQDRLHDMAFDISTLLAIA